MHKGNERAREGRVEAGQTEPQFQPPEDCSALPVATPIPLLAVNSCLYTLYTWVSFPLFRCSDFFLTSFSMCSTFCSKYRTLSCVMRRLCTLLCSIQPLLSNSGAIPCFTLDICAKQLGNLWSALNLQVACAVAGTLKLCPAFTSMS